jgi:hypothetical protein
MVGQMPPITRSGAKANRFCFAQRECSPNRANPARAGSLRCAAGGKNAAFRGEFLPSPKCRQDVQTGWRREGDLNFQYPSFQLHSN